MADRGGRTDFLGEWEGEHRFDPFRDDADGPEDVLLTDEREGEEPRENVQADEPEGREEPRPNGGARCPHDREAAEELERHRGPRRGGPGRRCLGTLASEGIASRRPSAWTRPRRK